MPKAECIRKHKNLYSILIARQLRPDSVNDKQKKETVQSLMDSAWLLASDPYDVEKMNLESTVKDNLDGKVTPTTEDLNKAKLKERAEKNLNDFNEKLQDLKKIKETEQKEAKVAEKKEQEEAKVAEEKNPNESQKPKPETVISKDKKENDDSNL